MISTNWISLYPVTSVCGVFSHRVLPSSAGGQSNSIASLTPSGQVSKTYLILGLLLVTLWRLCRITPIRLLYDMCACVCAHACLVYAYIMHTYMLKSMKTCMNSTNQHKICKKRDYTESFWCYIACVDLYNIPQLPCVTRKNASGISLGTMGL